VIAMLPLDQTGHLADSFRFLIFEAPRVLMLLTAVVMVMGMMNSCFTPERTRAMLAGKHEGVGNMMVVSLGIVTPFCSCSAVPLFIGFVQAGVMSMPGVLVDGKVVHAGVIPTKDKIQSWLF